MRLNHPPCRLCAGSTKFLMISPPTAEEDAHGARKTELYQCSDEDCPMQLESAVERFPRYTDEWHLLQIRQGRTAEWINRFTMLCRALSCRVRWVWCQRIMYGPRSGRSITNVGFMLIQRRKLGTILYYTPRDGARRCHIA